MKKVYTTFRILLFVGIIIVQLFPTSTLWSTTHIILFGGGVGLHYSPNSLTVAVGDTIQWQGDFTFHPMSSTSVPVGAATWNVISGTVFNYPVLIPGTYDYQCDVHFSFGMVGSFVASGSPSLDIPVLLQPANNSKGIDITPTLVWNSVATATTYHLQVSTTSDFSSIVQEDSLLIDTSKQVTGLLFNTSYYWRARAKNVTLTGNWSTPFFFTTRLQPTTHIVLFGGVLGFQYSPKNMEVIVGDTIEWQGDFSLHPLSSATIPAGASTWHVATGTVFTYPVVVKGFYNYICDFHFGSGMVGSFFAVDYSSLNSPNLLLPLNSSSGVSLNPTLTWNSRENTTKYHLQVSTTSNFLNIVQEDSLVTDTSKQVSGLNNNTVYYWRVRGKNILTLSNWSSPWSFKTIQNIPLVPLLLYPDSASINQPTTIRLAWNRATDADSYHVQISTDSLLGTLLQDVVTSDTSALIINLGKDSTYFWRVRSENNAGVSPWSVIWKFTTSASSVNISIALNDQWNMVSLPLLVSDVRKSVLFPTATTSAFYYSGGYNNTDSLENGSGYWMKFTPAQTVILSGNALVTDIVDVSNGWNMIGSISIPLPVTSLMSVPGGIITSTFFTYDGAGYVEVDSIRPGKGYWVKTNQSGQLILSSAALHDLSSRIVIKSTTDRPPLPPQGEVKEQSGETVTEFSLAQNYPNPFNPITTIQFDIPKASFVTLKVYNLLGQEVAMLVNEKRETGRYEVQFDGTKFTSGMYIYRIVAGDFVQMRKLLLVK